MSESPSRGAGRSPTLRTRSCPYPSINAAITYAVYFMLGSFGELSNIRAHSQQVSMANDFAVVCSHGQVRSRVSSRSRPHSWHSGFSASVIPSVYISNTSPVSSHEVRLQVSRIEAFLLFLKECAERAQRTHS